MELKDYTTEELRAELKRRTAEEKSKERTYLAVQNVQVLGGTIDYCGYPTNYDVGYNRPCKFWKTKTESIIDATRHQS